MEEKQPLKRAQEKASAFSLRKKLSHYGTQQLVLGIGNAI
jgi:hypothetical protein